jgi:hypothetical protein
VPFFIDPVGLYLLRVTIAANKKKGKVIDRVHSQKEKKEKKEKTEATQNKTQHNKASPHRDYLRSVFPLSHPSPSHHARPFRTTF